MSTYDANGLERVPFDGRVEARPDSRIPRRSTARNHGPNCSSNPEVGCLCDYDPGENATPDAYEQAEYRKGYDLQRAWLTGKTAEEARSALDARRSTVHPSPYNDGGTAATADYLSDHDGDGRGW